jgi:4'-phosphopantetheinyl transferase
MTHGEMREKIRVWFVEARPLKSDDLQYLTTEERAMAFRFRFEKDRRLFVHGRRVARIILGSELGVPPEAVRFRYGQYGKPELLCEEYRSRLAFNLAHSGIYVAFALGYNRRIGIDIEEERAGCDLLDLARHYFCTPEIAALERNRSRETELFFRFWSLKEAYLKAEGSGLSLQLTALDVTSIPDDLASPPALPIEDVPRGIHLQCLPAFAGYSAALAGDGAEWTSEIHVWRHGVRQKNQEIVCVEELSLR